MIHFFNAKRPVLLFTGAILFFAAQAQDTVHYGDPWYMYQDGYLDYFFPTSRANIVWNGVPIGGHLFDAHNATRPYAVPPQAGDGMLVYGVAITRYDSLCDWQELSAKMWRMTEQHTDWVSNPNGNTYANFEEVASADWHGCVRTCRFSYRMDDSDGVVISYEIYFDRPVMVTDTFYPGFVTRVATGESICPFYPSVTSTVTDVYTDLWVGSETAAPVIDAENRHWDKFKLTSPVWHPHPYYWGGFFPIVKVRCTVPRAGELRWRHGDTLALGFADDGEEHDDEVVWATLTETADTNATPARSGMGDSTVVLTGLEPGTVYWYRVRRSCRIVTDSMDLTVWTPWSEGRYVPGTLTAGLGAQAAGPRFEVSPNPAQGSAQVEVEGTEAYSLELIDVHGRTVRRWAAASGSRQLALDGVPLGLYLLRLTAARGTAMRRLVVRP